MRGPHRLPSSSMALTYFVPIVGCVVGLVTVARAESLWGYALAVAIFLCSMMSALEIRKGSRRVSTDDDGRR